MLQEILTAPSSFKLEIQEGKFFLHCQGEVIQQRFCEFLNTYNVIKSTDIEEYIFNLQDEFDTVYIPLKISGNTLVLSLASFLEIREVYFEMMHELRLNDMLYRSGVTFTV